MVNADENNKNNVNEKIIKSKLICFLPSTGVALFVCTGTAAFSACWFLSSGSLDVP